MASGLYDKAHKRALVGGLNWTSGNIKVTLIDTADHTPNLATHQYMNIDTVAAAAKVAVSSNLASKSVTAGVADSNAVVTFSAVSGDVSEALIIWEDGGGGGVTQSGTSDLLIALLESGDVTGLPVTPNGGDITITWDSGANAIFKL